MNSAGVMQRRGFLAIVLLGVVMLTVYLVHARLGGGSPSGEAKPAGVIAAAEPSGSASPNGPAFNAGGDGYGAAPNASASSSAPAAPPPGSTPVGVKTGSLTGKNVKQMGNVVVDSEGWTTYRFDLDSANPPSSTCEDVCLRSWLPILAEGTPALTGVDPAKVGTIERPDGGRQVTLGGWPLYRFLGDGAPAKWKGQAVNNSWWVVQPTGQRNVSCLPPGAVAPPA